MSDRIVRLTPRKAPFRRANIHFATLASVEVLAAKLSPDQVLTLVEEPLVDVDSSEDGGKTWTRFSLPPEGGERKITDAALSPDRAVDPGAPIFPREPVKTRDGVALPPEAADPAIPVARVSELETLLSTSEARGVDLQSRLDGLTGEHNAALARIAEFETAVAGHSELQGRYDQLFADHEEALARIAAFDAAQPGSAAAKAKAAAKS